MTALLALSISHYVDKYGGYAGVAAVVGLAILSMLYFAQAREVKRLREWAGRAPERAAELAARAAEAERLRAQGAPVPRATPLVSSRAVSATGPASQYVTPLPAGAVPAPVAAAAVALPTAEDDVTVGLGAGSPPATNGAVAAAALPVPAEGAAVEQATPVPGAAVEGEAAEAAVEVPALEGAAVEAAALPGASDADAAAGEQAAIAASGAGAPDVAAVGARRGLSGLSGAGALSGAVVHGAPRALSSAGAVAAGAAPPAEADGVPASSPALPEESELEPAGVAARALAGAPGAGRRASGNGAAVVDPPGAVRGSRPSLPPAPLPPKRAAGAPKPAPSGRRHSLPHPHAPSRRRQPLAPIDGPRVPSRRIGAIVAALAVTIALVVVLVEVLGGGSHKPPHPAATATRSPQTAPTPPARSQALGAGGAASPASLRVVVINSTQITGLAAALSSDLQRNGYTQAAFLHAQPTTQLATSTVMYVAGDQADAREVAQVLGITATAPINSATRSITGTAPVVVVAGTDQANAVGGGGAGGQ